MSMGRLRRSLPAFTLIELLIVIVIIAILLVILVPALMNRSQDKVAAVSVLKGLQDTLEAYYAKYQAYPPSNVPGNYPGASQITSGAQALYYFLQGPRGEGWGPEDADGGIKAKGMNWLPSKDIRADWLSKSEPRYFVDGLGDEGKPFLYYRAAIRPKTNAVADVFQKSDNAQFWNPSDSEWRALLADPAANNMAVNRQSYILMSPGTDREYGFKPGLPVTDDISNFRSK